MNVFDIVKEYDLLMAELEDNGGELTPELTTKLNINQEEIDKKVHAYHFIIKTKEAEIQLAKDEQQRLMTVRTSKENSIKRLKKLVDLAVETFGVYKPKAVNKSLTFSDLSVSQKKTEALEIEGEIDDERFCRKQVTFNLQYQDAEFLLKLVEEEGKNFLTPIVTTIVDNARLKEWLIDNEEEHKKLLIVFEERIKLEHSKEFEEQLTAIVGRPYTEEELQRNKDTKIILAAKINHNSTVIFR